MAKLNVSYEDHDIKQCHTVEYLECHVDSNLSCESMGIKFFWKSMTHSEHD